jgi:hypothetical protein
MFFTEMQELKFIVNYSPLTIDFPSLFPHATISHSGQS